MEATVIHAIVNSTPNLKGEEGRQRIGAPKHLRLFSSSDDHWEATVHEGRINVTGGVPESLPASLRGRGDTLAKITLRLQRLVLDVTGGGTLFTPQLLGMSWSLEQRLATQRVAHGAGQFC